MKKIFAVLIAVMIVVGSLSACGKASDHSASDNDKIQIITTIFPEYDWVMNVLGDNPAGAEVTMLLGNGVDLHSYQPTADDIMKISTCDIFIYVGGESDGWVKDALKEASNKDMIVINLLDVLGDSVKAEEVVEGMESEDDHDLEESVPGKDQHEGEKIEYDEHVWLSLRNASVLTEKISEAIQAADSSNAKVYQANTESFLEKLDTLDTEYNTAAAESPVKTLLFGDRFPFRYMVDDYGLDYYAAFAGCSAETEASFETITFLAKKVDELSLHAVMTIEGTDHRIAETIVQNTKTHDQQILTMDSMQSVTANDVENGASYLSIMESNLAVLREALK